MSKASILNGAITKVPSHDKTKEIFLQLLSYDLEMATNEYLITLERNSIMEAFVATKQNKKKKRKLTNFDVFNVAKNMQDKYFHA